MSIVDFGSYLPGDPLGIESFCAGTPPEGSLADNPLFRAPLARHHIAPDQRAADMIDKAARPMFKRMGIEPDGNVDLLITNVLLPDMPITGSGAETADRLGCVPDWIIDLHNGGCASFPYMLKLASTIMASGTVRTALLANVQNTAGQIFAQPDVRTLPHAAVPGDGCGVAFLTLGNHSPVLGVETRNQPNTALDVGASSPDGRRYWQPGHGQLDVRFNPDKTAEILERGNRIVPEVVKGLCQRLDFGTDDIDLLVTNQPNRIFMRHWRESLGLDQKQHLETFDQFGNLYGAGVPVTLNNAVRANEVPDGSFVVLAGFAHAGDFAAAAALRWHNG